MRAALLIAGSVFLLSGCAHLDYIGETTHPTTDVQVFYTEANVPRAYRVMGEVVATSGLFVSTRKIQDQMIDKARQKGADAVVILGIEHYKAGESSSYSESTTESQDKKGRTHLSTSGSSSTSSEENKKIRALFIKFRAPGETSGGAAAPADSAR
jgi:hypothetical protein